MKDPLQYMTLAAWLQGYANGIPDRKAHETLISKLNKAAEMLRQVWLEYEEKEKKE